MALIWPPYRWKSLQASIFRIERIHPYWICALESNSHPQSAYLEFPIFSWFHINNGSLTILFHIMWRITILESFKPSRASSKFTIIVRFSLFFQYHKQPFYFGRDCYGAERDTLLYLIFNLGHYPYLQLFCQSCSFNEANPVTVSIILLLFFMIWSLWNRTCLMGEQ